MKEEQHPLDGGAEGEHDEAPGNAVTTASSSQWRER